MMLFFASIVGCGLIILQRCSAEQELFAVLGRESCSQNLASGNEAVTELGSTDGKHTHYLSTNSVSRDVKHAYWLQIVTSNGVDELFRIYWTFSRAKRLSEIIRSAASTGEEVQYRVVDSAAKHEYTFNSLWKIDSKESFETTDPSDVTAILSTSTGAMWGTTRTNSEAQTTFWGIGSSTQGSAECGAVYNNGVESEFSSQGRTYFYLSTEPFDTASTSLTTLATDTLTSSTRSNTSSTPSTYTPNVHSRMQTAALSDMTTPAGYELFAIVGENSCAQNLYYGPSAISATGSADGHQYYLATNTAGKNRLHNRWLQIITDQNGVEKFRITWVFGTYKTLANHIINAVTTGESVTYTVSYTPSQQTFVYDSVWRFSSVSAVSASRFAATSSQCCFSANGGAWGAGAPVVNANTVNYNSQAFWGTGNYASYDQAQCQYVFLQGQPYSLGGGATPRSYLYYANDGPPTTAPTASPTTAMPTTSKPTAEPTSGKPSFSPSWRPSAAPTTSTPTYTVTSKPSAVPTTLPTTLPTTTPAPTTVPTTATPSCYPTILPTTTAAPTAIPTTATPSADPSVSPTFTPTVRPSTQTPTVVPTRIPTLQPTLLPTTTPAPTTTPTTATPTLIPTRTPSRTPTLAPTPTPRPTYTPSTELFAVVGGSSCAENLYYGPQAITTSGSADGLYPYFLSTSTDSRDIEHTEWMQVVTSDGTNELFRIYWTFNTAKTLAQRFAGAVSSGESVTYRIVQPNTNSNSDLTYTGTWWFGSKSRITTGTFDTTTTRCCFSADDGVWGGGIGTIDGNNANTQYNSFWGIGNLDATDSMCRNVYRNGVAITALTRPVTYMYYSASGADGETFNLKFQISMLMRPMDYDTYLTKTALYQSIISKTISSTLTTVAERDVSDIVVEEETTSSDVSASVSSVSSASVGSSGSKGSGGSGVGGSSDGGSAMSTYRYLRRAVSLTPRRLDTTNSTTRVTCTITLTASAYTLFELSQQLQTAIDSGAIDTNLHTYANSLGAPELNNTMVVSATTSDLSRDSSSDTRSAFMTPGIIVAIVIGAIAVMILIGTVIVSCVRGENPSDWLWARGRRRSRVWVDAPAHDGSSHSESDLPAYPATATYAVDVDIDAEIATINQFHTSQGPVVGVLASQDSDLDDFVAQPRQHRRHRNARGDPRGANEVAWGANGGRGGRDGRNDRDGRDGSSGGNGDVEMHPMDVVVPRAVVARHQRNAPVVRAHYVDGDVPDAEEASVNYGQYGSDVVVAEAFVPNT